MLPCRSTAILCSAVNCPTCRPGRRKRVTTSLGGAVHDAHFAVHAVDLVDSEQLDAIRIAAAPLPSRPPLTVVLEVGGGVTTATKSLPRRAALQVVHAWRGWYPQARRRVRRIRGR